MATSTPISINAYIAGFPKDVQAILQEVRNAIKRAAPGAEETISYGMPAFTLRGRYLIYFAGYKNHIGLYPAPRGHEAFKEELSAYKGGKGTVQFPLKAPMPVGLITKIVNFRISESLAKKDANEQDRTLYQQKVPDIYESPQALFSGVPAITTPQRGIGTW